MYVLAYTYTLLTMQIDHCGPFSWGQSAGAMSSALHMLHNNGDPGGLFRAAFMESGSPLPTGYVDNPLCQATFDDFVSNAECSGSEYPIACLRNVSTDVFVRAVKKAPSLSDYKVCSTRRSCDHRMIMHLTASRLTLAAESRWRFCGVSSRATASRRENSHHSIRRRECSRRRHPFLLPRFERHVRVLPILQHRCHHIC